MNLLEIPPRGPAVVVGDHFFSAPPRSPNSTCPEAGTRNSAKIKPERIPGPDLVDFLGIPINAEARQWALSWDPDRLTLPEHQMPGSHRRLASIAALWRCEFGRSATRKPRN